MNQGKKLIKDISANGLQIIVNQLIGLVLFYVSSTYLLKEDFGKYNWAVAVCSTIIAIASLGLDLIVVKRVAADKSPRVVVGIHLFHGMATGVVAILFLLLIRLFYAGAEMLLLPVFVYLVVGNLSNSYKLCLNGMEAYKQLARVLIGSNVIKLVGVLVLLFTGYFGIGSLIVLYVLASFVELLMAAHMANKHFDGAIKPIPEWKTYASLVQEALPQLGVVLFDSALARIDWILLGLVGTAVATAEYSFAYRVFELSKLPLLVLSPILLTRLSKLYAEGDAIDKEKEDNLMSYFKLEMVVVMFIPLVLVQVWTPLVDFFTHGKYGAVNETTYAILAICIPIHAMINFLWTLAFVKGFLKSIMWITVLSSLLNIGANLVLIPMYSSLGAAVAFLISTVIQSILYIILIKRLKINLNIWAIAMVMLFALLSLAFVHWLALPLLLSVILSTVVFLLLSIFGKQLELKKIKSLLMPGKA